MYAIFAWPKHVGFTTSLLLHALQKSEYRVLYAWFVHVELDYGRAELHLDYRIAK